MPRPVCFMVMPFGTKSTGTSQEGAPAEVDFNALWEHALAPAIEDAGFEPVRADQEIGALIVVEMLERLTWADLVLADLSIANANVYYEIGVRHAASEAGCVLVAADWSRQVFDLDQIRGARYPLPEREVGKESATAIRKVVTSEITKRKAGRSPVFESVPGYQVHKGDQPPSSFRKFVEDVSEFHAKLKAAWRTPSSRRAERALALSEEYAAQGSMLPAIALELLLLLRDTADWKDVLKLVESFPKDLRGLPAVREQLYLAQSKAGDPADAIAGLEQMIEDLGNTPDRSGLLGGRYKRLWRDESLSEAEREDYLELAIETYERGMDLDLNDYYCSGNLAQLYRARGEEDDEVNARRSAAITLSACERAQRLGSGDEYLPATLLGATFDTRDLERAKRVLKKVRREPTVWKLKSLLRDLRTRRDQIEDAGLRAGFASIVEQLEALAE